MVDARHLDPVQVLLVDGSSRELPSLQGSMRWDSLEQFRITRKRSLAEGLVALNSALFQIVLLDLSVATVSSMDSLTDVVESAKGVPVIVMLNEGGMTKASEAMRLGASDYVLKGCECNSLVRAMKHAVERNLLIAAADDTKAMIARGSHELRNCLACIHQFCHILLDGLAGPISDEQREYLGIILQNASQVRSIVDNLREPVPCAGKESLDQTARTFSANGAN